MLRRFFFFCFVGSVRVFFITRIRMIGSLILQLRYMPTASTMPIVLP